MISDPNLRNRNWFLKNLGLIASLNTQDLFCTKNPLPTTLPLFGLPFHRAIFLRDKNTTLLSFDLLLPVHNPPRNHKSICFDYFLVFFRYPLHRQYWWYWCFLNGLRTNDWCHCILDLCCMNDAWLLCRKDCLICTFWVILDCAIFIVRLTSHWGLFYCSNKKIACFSFFIRFIHTWIDKIQLTLRWNAYTFLWVHLLPFRIIVLFSELIRKWQEVHFAKSLTRLFPEHTLCSYLSFAS